MVPFKLDNALLFPLKNSYFSIPDNVEVTSANANLTFMLKLVSSHNAHVIGREKKKQTLTQHEQLSLYVRYSTERGPDIEQ